MSSFNKEPYIGAIDCIKQIQTRWSGVNSLVSSIRVSIDDITINEKRNRNIDEEIERYKTIENLSDVKQTINEIHNKLNNQIEVFKALNSPSVDCEKCKETIERISKDFSDAEGNLEKELKINMLQIETLRQEQWNCNKRILMAKNSVYSNLSKISSLIHDVAESIKGAIKQFAFLSGYGVGTQFAINIENNNQPIDDLLKKVDEMLSNEQGIIEFLKQFNAIVSMFEPIDYYLECVIVRVKRKYFEESESNLFGKKCCKKLFVVLDYFICFIMTLLPCIMDRFFKFMECVVYENNKPYFFILFVFMSLGIIIWFACEKIPTDRKKLKVVISILAKVDSESYYSIEEFKRDLDSLHGL